MINLRPHNSAWILHRQSTPLFFHDDRVYNRRVKSNVSIVDFLRIRSLPSSTRNQPHRNPIYERITPIFDLSWPARPFVLRFASRSPSPCAPVCFVFQRGGRGFLCHARNQRPLSPLKRENSAAVSRPMRTIAALINFDRKFVVARVYGSCTVYREEGRGKEEGGREGGEIDSSSSGGWLWVEEKMQ